MPIIEGGNNMKNVGTLAYRAKCERDCCEEYRREWHRSPLDVDGLSFQVFTDKPNVNFNVTLKEDKWATIKFEEQSRLGTFVVGVAPNDGASIVYKRDNVICLDDPLEKLIEIFPDSPRMKKFVKCLLNSK